MCLLCLGETVFICVVVIPYSYLALPPSRPLFPSATETVKPEGPSSPASRYQARPLIGHSDPQDA